MATLLRQTLDLFAELLPAPVARQAPPRRVAPTGRRSIGPIPPAGRQGPAQGSLLDDPQTLLPPLPPEQANAPQPPAKSALAPAAPAEPLHRALSPAQFAHPRASRELRLEDVIVAYEFVRARRRSIGFVVGPDGLSVRAPRWTPLPEVEAALREKSRWIVRKLHEVGERQRRQEAARVVWADGVSLPLRGAPLRVVLDPSHGFSGKGAALQTDAQGNVTLHVGLPHGAAPTQIRDAVQAWLMREALGHFQARVQHFAPQLGVQVQRLRLSSAGTRWGSASADGTVRLNWRLIHLTPSLIDYVVVHELAHLRVMDHSPRFWDTVGRIVPDYAERRSQLRADAIPRW